MAKSKSKDESREALKAELRKEILAELLLEFKHKEEIAKKIEEEEVDLLDPKNIVVERTDSNKHIRDLLTGISDRYFELSMLCMRSRTVREKFENPEYTLDFLTTGYRDREINWEGCGMIIPPHTQVTFNKELMWPTFWIKSKDKTETATIQVSPLELLATLRRPKSEGESSPGEKSKYEIIEKRLEFERWSAIEAIVFDDDFKHYDLHLEMPWFVPDEDVAWSVRLADSEEPDILITSSC
ncbi:MAG: hypothetical protein ACPGJS_10150 [Flammeovirgaceae bacterium]